MRRCYLLPAAFLLDLVVGDPEWFPHPVRLMGLAISKGESVLRAPDGDPLADLLAGTILTIGVVTAAFYVTRTIERFAYQQSKILGGAAEVFLAWTCLASRNLVEEAASVFTALDREDITAARNRISRIVGRDTAALDASEVSRALIETLAESTADGIMAPLFYLAIGGAPLAMAYKAVNTLDSMIGHRNQKYLYFGKVAARLDDAVNLIPSRLTALSMVGAAVFYADASALHAWNTWLRDGSKHKSPNAGQSEAAMSGALRVRLGGENRYDGELISSPWMGKEFLSAAPGKARQAIDLTMITALIGLAVGILITTVAQRRDV